MQIQDLNLNYSAAFRARGAGPLVGSVMLAAVSPPPGVESVTQQAGGPWEAGQQTQSLPAQLAHILSL